MPSRRRPTFNWIVKETEKFLDYLDANNYPDLIKRDDFRTIYNTGFVQARKAEVREYVSVAFRDIVKELRDTNSIHELGDYFSFGNDVQVLYEDLAVSKEFKETLEKWKAVSKDNPYFCEVCGVDCGSEKSYEQHVMGNRHRIHKLHLQIYSNRDQRNFCPDDILIVSDPQPNAAGMIEKDCKPGQGLAMSVTIRNLSAQYTLVFERHLFLWDTGMFRLLKKDSKEIKLRHHIQPEQSFEMRVQCKAPNDFGHHFAPLAFYFGWKDERGQAVSASEQQGPVTRFVALHVLGDLHDDLAPVAPFKYPDQIPEELVEQTVPGVPLPVSTKNVLPSTTKLVPCRVPVYLKAQVKRGLTGNMQIISEKLRNVLDCDLTAQNYKNKFDTLLWIEELQMVEDIKRYDMLNVTLEQERGTRLLILQVPGLMERRPSVLKGDRVYLYADGNGTIQYEAFVHRVELNNIYLGVGQRFPWVQGMRYDARFDFTKFNLWVQHRALNSVIVAESILFPSSQSRFPVRTENVDMKPWFDKKLNPEQQTAVTNIVRGTSRPGPYLIFGPPGTGKTVTVTEAIRQVYHCQPDARILVCCPENTAADFVMKKLINPNQPGTVDLSSIFRMYAVSRPYISVPSYIKESGRLNYDSGEREFYYPAKTELNKHKILIVTLSTAGRLVSAGFTRNYFTHIFIDEGAHAVEPECIVPITGLLDSRTQQCGQLVIAGDPKQLGPILRSPFSLNYGLDKSILERLMTDIPEYKRAEMSGYDAHYLTKLVRNYRSHDAILKVPRELFYDGELQPCGDTMILNSMVNWEHLPNKKFPVIFHSVFGKDEREESSPSFFNRDEISQVQKYLDMLLKEKKGGQKIKPSDIGIISPYRKQVEKIRKMVEKKHYGKRNEIMVGSVEEFQGQEFKVIIISTVRSNENFVDIDLKYHLGFVRNPKRFNVALTRARALLIVIGDPLVLEKDPNWKRFIDYCDANRGFKGQHGFSGSPGSSNRRGNSGNPGNGDDSGNPGSAGEAEVTNEEIYNRMASMTLQAEDPEWETRN
ncbi:putative helicase mov-10-B.1 [Mercenaria mercenaria]|uniref:putative helicase mov-10-B.1 n=1 Tax=Mercenaria mercenaria TaxID=6596 RepID=UPI00234F5F1E|nr:putative helicase mov-10-B.1 [Mercenaria mercenaria]XP_045199398.2 putative helicase mov-10-B.1 [Mercenaria mercenaria]